MNAIKRAYVRATSVIASMLVLVVGVTFAAVNTQATLLGSTLSTTATDLLVWNGNAFANSAPGFTVDDLVPGIGSPEFTISFKNTGGGAMALSARIPTAPKFSGFNSTSASTALKGIKVTIKNASTNEKIDTTLYALTLTTEVGLPGPVLKGGVTGNPLAVSSEGNYIIKFDVDPAAIGTAKAVVENFDIVFSAKPASAV